MSSFSGIALSCGRGMSASFSFTDLYHDPTPEEIYESPPRAELPEGMPDAEGTVHCLSTTLDVHTRSPTSPFW
jgi:hypothetical protein